MGIEIERKFLVKNDSWRVPGIQGIFLKQGYLKNSVESVVRIRIAGKQGYITVKGKTINALRLEFEYEIPADDAEEMLEKLCRKPLIEKIRYTVRFKGFEWVIDEFSGRNKGLKLAEIELEERDIKFEYPEWIGKEVTDDPGYFNSNLLKNPKPVEKPIKKHLP